MKIKATTPASVSLQAGPLIGPGRVIELGEPLSESLKTEIDENIKKGLLANVEGSPAPAPFALGRKRGR